jgi:hypothetical protein
LSLIGKGTFHSAILKANHSAIAVFQTQASQTKTGLFFVFLFKIEINLSTSTSLQIILSIFQSFASFVRFVEKKSNAGVVLSCCLFGFCSIFWSKGVVGHNKIFSAIVQSKFSIASSSSSPLENSATAEIPCFLYHSSKFFSQSIKPS